MSLRLKARTPTSASPLPAGGSGAMPTQAWSVTKADLSQHLSWSQGKMAEGWFKLLHWEDIEQEEVLSPGTSGSAGRMGRRQERDHVTLNSSQNQSGALKH